MAVGLMIAGITGCDLNDPDEIQNGSNFAIIRIQFFESRLSRVPVPGVRMIVESPGDESERPYNGPDVVGISGEDGIAEVRIFPGLDPEFQQGGGAGGQGGGGQTPTGPQSPLDLPPPLFFADVAVVFIYNGQIVSFISTGLTVGSGRMYDLGAVFLDEFGVLSD
jgi:hypothetical protein